MLSLAAIPAEWMILPLLVVLVASLSGAHAISAEPERVAAARLARGEAVRELCQAAGLGYPPHELFVRAFKDERVVEAWGRDRGLEYALIKSFPVTLKSGVPGPKRRKADGQIPEGFYHIDAFNPNSRFHLSLRVSYPNASDRILSDHEQPGGDIYIHGGAKSIGCLPLGDLAIEELYLLALDVSGGRKEIVPVHIFPARMVGPSWDAFVEEHARNDPGLAAFWENLKIGYDRFERDHRVPKVTVDEKGWYVVRPGR